MATTYIPYSGEIVTRADAVSAGVKRYFTGRPCLNGHFSQYYTQNAVCIACTTTRAAEWRKNNRPRFDAAAALWMATNKERYAETARVRLAKPDRAANRKAVNQLWNERNKERVKEKRDALRLANPLRWKCYAENRRARKLASGGVHTPEQIANLAKLQRNRCAGCETSIKAGFEADHITALSKGGSNDIHNIQLLCRKCNRSKHSKDPIVWAQSNGRLL